MKDIYPLIFYLGGIQGVILALFLFLRKKNLIAYRLLGILTLILGLIVIAFGLQSDGIIHENPHLLVTFSRLLFLIFPLLYLMVKYLFTNYDRFKRLDLVHFIPFIVLVLLYLDFYPMSAGEKVQFLDETSFSRIMSIIEQEFLMLQGIAYSFMALHIMNRYKSEIIYYTSNIHKTLLRVTRTGLIILLIAWIIGSIAVNLEIIGIDLKFNAFIIVYLFVVVDIYWISFNTIKSPEIFKLEREELYPSKSHPDETANVTVNEEDDKLINERLLQLLEDERPYLEHDLSLPELASRLEITRNRLSGVINRMHKKNFFEFINTYRINEVKRLLQDPQNKDLKIISLAYDAGFNSKSSFNRVFKMITNMTPSQYQEKIRQQLIQQ